MTLRLALAASSALLLSYAAPAYAETATAPEAAATTPAPQSEHDKLFALFEDADARELALNPLSRLFRGDDENADRLGDFLTDSSFLAGRTDIKLNLALLSAIDRSKLDETDQLNHFFGLHTYYPQFASGTGVAQFKTLAHYEDNLSRHDDYIAFIDRAIGRFREGMKRAPTKTFPDGISEGDKARLTKAYEAKTAELYAAHAALRDFLRDEYLPAARESIGLTQMKGGEKLYARLVEDSTTLPLTPDAIHQLGLSRGSRASSRSSSAR